MAEYVLIDETGGAATSSGEAWTLEKLEIAARLLEIYLNRDVASEWGGADRVRVGISPTDINPGERVHTYMATLPKAPDDVAYHDKDGQGVPYSMQAIGLTRDLFGPLGALQATSHEMAEMLGDPGTNRYAKDGKGRQFAIELCDAVEMQSYSIHDETTGTDAYVSNFLTQAFFDPGNSGPFDFLSTMAQNDQAPMAPFQTAPGNGGNYQIVDDEGQNETTVNAIQSKIETLRAEGSDLWRELRPG
jgi:hypothetical protein